MRKIIGGKVYDTDKASLVCDISPIGLYQGDFAYEDTSLYKTSKGTFFIAGEGGPRSRWAQPDGTNGMRSGSGVALVDEDEARALCERHGTEQAFVDAFGEPEEG